MKRFRVTFMVLSTHQMIVDAESEQDAIADAAEGGRPITRTGDEEWDYFEAEEIIDE